MAGVGGGCGGAAKVSALWSKAFAACHPSIAGWLALLRLPVGQRSPPALQGAGWGQGVEAPRHAVIGCRANSTLLMTPAANGGGLGVQERDAPARARCVVEWRHCLVPCDGRAYTDKLQQRMSVGGTCIVVVGASKGPGMVQTPRSAGARRAFPVDPYLAPFNPGRCILVTLPALQRAPMRRAAALLRGGRDLAASHYNGAGGLVQTAGMPILDVLDVGAPGAPSSWVSVRRRCT